MIAAFMEANWCLSMTGEKPQIQITKDNREKRKEVALERRNPQETDDMRVRSSLLLLGSCFFLCFWRCVFFDFVFDGEWKFD